jgi:hypothetical protein
MRFDDRGAFADFSFANLKAREFKDFLEDYQKINFLKQKKKGC